MVNRNQTADEVIHRVRQINQMETNLTAMIERIMAQNGLNTELRRPNYTSPLTDYVLQTEFPRGCKIPKFTKFSGDTSESTKEHIAKNMTKAGDLANNEDLRMKFCLLKARCFTVVSEHQLVEMAAGGLDYSIRKKFDTQYMRDMAQLADRVAYVEVHEGEPEIFEDQYGFEDYEVDLAELKEAGPYTCKMITPSNGKNPVEIEKNDKFPKKTYTFSITKCDEIFDLLVKVGQNGFAS
ncbi:uncharacterized protein LOC131642484 [Vicia villosa]|uniref:uncharacterized protein LOC131642484 n=1 Tax=Vicia villosa TaxID=3911 RepID=UPI00273B87EC|nr:uncharacterized protein LOC131642484 [Vicia villosa]